MSLQAELAYIQAKLSTLQRLLPPPLHSPSSTARHNPLPETTPGSDMGLLPNVPMLLDPLQTQLGCNETTSSFLNPIDHEDEMDEDGELQSLAREFVSRYLPGVGFRPPCSQIWECKLFWGINFVWALFSLYFGVSLWDRSVDPIYLGVKVWWIIGLFWSESEVGTVAFEIRHVIIFPFGHLRFQL